MPTEQIFFQPRINLGMLLFGKFSRCIHEENKKKKQERPYADLA